MKLKWEQIDSDLLSGTYRLRASGGWLVYRVDESELELDGRRSMASAMAFVPDADWLDSDWDELDEDEVKPRRERWWDRWCSGGGGGGRPSI
jgi:hypothetical protein